MATRQRASLSGETLVVYPTGLKAQAVARERAASGQILLGGAITTFPELTDRLAIDFGISQEALPPALARVVLGAAARERRSTFSDRPGLLRELHGVIEELAAAYLGAEDVAAIARDLRDTEAGTRLAEIADVYAGYEASLARLGMTDRHARTRAVVDRLAHAVANGSRPASLVGVQRVVFAEIYDYSVLQFLLATALIHLVGDAELIAFAHPENVAATRFLDRTWNRFVGAERLSEHVLPSFVRRDGRSGAIDALLRGLFASDRPPPGTSDRSVRTVVAPHRYGEVEAALRAIRDRLRTGTAPERVAILARDMTRYRDPIIDVARRFGIPLEHRAPSGALAAGAARFVVDLWHLAAAGLPRVSLASVLDSDYTGGRPGMAAGLLAKVGYVSERVASLETCIAAASAADSGRRRMSRRWLRGVHAIRELGRAGSVSEHVRAMRSALSALRFQPVARESLAPDVAARDAAAIGLVSDVLSELATLDQTLGLGAVGPRDMADMVGSILAELSAPAAGPSRRGVRALSVQDARGLDFDAVFVVGLDDGTFPAPHRESVLLPDWLRRQVNAAAGRRVRERLGERAEGLPLGALLRTVREAQLEEPFLFFLACSMATTELVLVRPATDGPGTPCVPSPYLAEVAACFDAPVPEDVLDPTQSVPALGICAEPRELMARRTLDRWRGRGALWSLVDEALQPSHPVLLERTSEIDRRVAMERGRIRYFLTPGEAHTTRAHLADSTVGRLSEDDALRTRIAGRPWTATAVERLAACGFKFFAADVLRLAERREPEADADPLEGGTLLHAAIEAVLRGGVLPMHRNERREHVEAVLDRVRDTVLATVGPKDEAVTDVRWRRIVEAVVEIADIEARRWQEAGDGDRRSEVEWAFDWAGTSVAGVGVPATRGRIDLVDVITPAGGPPHIVVTDFKSSRDRTKIAKRISPGVLGTSGFQLPLYLDAARHLLAPDAEDVELEGRFVAAFAPIGQKVVSVSIRADAMTSMLVEVQRLVDRAAAGHFDVDPLVCDEWCRFRSVCRYVRTPTEEGDG